MEINFMCGIIGYFGKQEALPIIVGGLKKLEYRGYDSAGVAVIGGNGEVFSCKAVGKIKELEEKISHDKGLLCCEKSGNNCKARVHIGIGHTRWATHGAPTEINAHPHTDCAGKVWLAHNGIIENYQALKATLESRGHKFKSETDTEVIAHLIEDFYSGNRTETLMKVLKLLKGTYGLVVMHSDEPEKLLAARNGSPLVIGLGENETIFASDVSVILRYTRQAVYLNDGEVAEINDGGFKIYDLDQNELSRNASEVEWDDEACEKGGYAHFMMKEIFEQPESIANSMRGRTIPEEGKAKLGGLESALSRIRETEKIIITACGTARLSGMVGEYMLEEYAGVDTEVDYAHEFRYRKPVLNNKPALLAISQSGETADTLAAVREGKEKGALTLGIVNVVGSTIARDTDAGVYNHTGPEIAVASTKAFTSQLAILALITVMLGRQRDMSLVTGERIIRELSELPEKIREVLKQNEHILRIAQKYCHHKNFAFLGRKYNHPIAMEGALKLKELSYIHAEGFAAGEMKHGAIAMIDENFPSVYIAPEDSVFEKNLSNMMEIKARKGKIIVITTEGNERVKDVADEIIYIPKTLEMLTPILSVVPLQLFAYHMAVLNGRDVDRPRNLAKSVTVE